MARRFAGESDSPPDSEVVWADAETPTVAQTTDAVIKQFQAGLIPQETALEKLGYSQTQVRRIMASATQSALLAALNPPAPPAVPTVPPVARVTVTADVEVDEVTCWRERILEQAGYGADDAHLIAERPEIDLHVAVYLAEAGCSVETALRILL